MNSNPLKKPAQSRSQLFLRVKHPTLDPAEITRELGIDPEHAVRAGESLSAQGKPAIHSESYWLAELPNGSISEVLDWSAMAARPILSDQLSREEKRAILQSSGLLELQILMSLSQLDRHVDFLRAINEAQGSITVVLERKPPKTSFTLSPRLARKLADLGVRLEIA